MSEATDVVEYLIVGGGMTADAAVRGIRSEDPEGQIRLLSAEPHPPYDRPPLSKGLWKGEPEERVHRETGDLQVDLRLDTRAVSLETDPPAVVDDSGTRHEAQRILLATGARPRRLADSHEGVIYLRTLDDYRRLRAHLETAQRIAVVGGGFIGCEIAGSLAAASEAEVHLAFPEEMPLAGKIPPPFDRYLARTLEDMGVTIHSGVEVTGVEEDDRGHYRLQTGEEDPSPDPGDTQPDVAPVREKESRALGTLPSLPFDVVVAGLGVEPCVELARDAGLEVAGGIVVDHGLLTSAPHIWAAGDVARFPLSLTGRREILGHEEHANESGMLAGRAMAGASVRYDPLPYVYSGVGELTLEVVGLPSPEDEVEVEAGTGPLDPGCARYFRNGRTTGVLIWNRPGRAFKVKREWSSKDDNPGPGMDRLRELILQG